MGYVKINDLLDLMRRDAEPVQHSEGTLEPGIRHPGAHPGWWDGYIESRGGSMEVEGADLEEDDPRIVPVDQFDRNQFVLWTTKYVYFLAEFDGAYSFDFVDRNPPLAEHVGRPYPRTFP